MIESLTPHWPAPGSVHALITTRQGGVSLPPYDSLNLAAHVGDDPQAVRRNRRRLREAFRLPGDPCWLNQVHGNGVIEVDGRAGGEADGAFTSTPGVVCAVLTADCLPLLICDRRGRQVCAVHAGWRGLAAGVIERAVAEMEAGPENLLVWLGPAIGPQVFEVGDEVRRIFVQAEPEDESAFKQGEGDRWLADIYRLARQRLARLGVGYVGGGDYCTLEEPRFFSYRRDGATGRMASLIWFDRTA